MSDADDRHYLRAAVEGLKCMCAVGHLETLDALEAENQRRIEHEDRFRRVLVDAERALLDAEKIIESRTGKGSWVGSLILARVTATLNETMHSYD